MSIINLYRQDKQPFAQIPNAAIRDPRISPNAFRLLAYLMSHQDGYELNYEQIERQTTLGRYAINQASKQLVELGWIAVDRPKVNGQFAAKTWTVLDPTSVDDSTAGHSTVGDSTMEQPTDIRRTLNKENKELRTQQLRTNSANDFELFWEIYPRKQSKPAAQKAFIKALKSADSETIIQGAKLYAHDPNREPGFTKLAATWLNNECWDDEQLPSKQQAPQRQQQQEQARQDFLNASTPQVFEQQQIENITDWDFFK
jgi:hypothetical protein